MGVALLALSCGATAPGGDGTDAVGQLHLHLDFNRPQTEGAKCSFDAGAGGWADALVIESEPGVLQIVEGAEPSSRAVAFPPACQASACPRALVRLPDDDRLDPGGQDFKYGVRVRLPPDQTAAGSNLVQKGRYGTPGGQWKLQVDGAEGRPSCVLQGEVGENRETVRLVANQGIADNRWHWVSCQIADDRLTIVIDDMAKTIDAEVGTVGNAAGVRIGASGPKAPADQFHGIIDDMVFCLGTCRLGYTQASEPLSRTTPP